MKSTFISYIRDMSLKWKMILAYTTFAVIIVAVAGLTTYTICVKQIEGSEKKLLLQNLKQTMNFVDFNFGMYMKKSDMIFSNTIIQSVLSKQYKDNENYEVYTTYQDSIYKIIDPIMQDIIYPELSTKSFSAGMSNSKVKVVIYVDNPTLPKDGSLISDYENIKNYDWSKSIESNSKGILWRGPFTLKDIVSSKDVEYVSLNRVMKNFSTRKKIGILSLMMSRLQLTEIVNRNNSDPLLTLFLVDDSGKLIVNSSNKSNITEEDIKGLMKNPINLGEMKNTKIGDKDFILSYVQSEFTGWRLIGLYSYESISNRVQPIKYTVLAVLFGSIVLSIIITVYIAFIITRRLNRITRKMSLVKQDRFTLLEEVKGNDEIGQFDRSFNDMVKSINTLVEREQRLVLQKNSLHLELLQMQINPHILYNTLSTIGWSVKKAGQEEVFAVIENLIRFFKFFLNKGDVITGLRNELEMIKKYIDIICFTYRLDCNYNINVEEAVYEYASLNLILQPLVENALIHGIKPSGRPGILDIDGRVYGKDIYFKIRDNGAGMEPEMVSALENCSYTKESGSYGVSNVIKRIRLYYGQEYGLSFESSLGEGTTVVVKIPALTYEELKKKMNTEF